MRIVPDRLTGRKYFIATPQSSVTKYINYSELDNILEVEYKHGAVYQYFDVPKAVWKEYEETVRSGQSSGTFLNTEIKAYSCVRLY